MASESLLGHLMKQRESFQSNRMHFPLLITILDACKEFEIYIKSTLLTADSSVFKTICELGLKNVHKSSNNETLTI